MNTAELNEKAVSLAKKAVRAYGASVEGWLQRIKLAALQSHFKDVLEKELGIKINMRFDW